MQHKSAGFSLALFYFVLDAAFRVPIFVKSEW